MSHPWMADAACRGLTGLMFPELGDPAGVRYAPAVCDDCSVWWPCLSWAMSPDAPVDGVLAELSPRERLELRRDTRASRPRPVSPPRQPADTAEPMPWFGRWNAPMITWTKAELLEARDIG